MRLPRAFSPLSSAVLFIVTAALVLPATAAADGLEDAAKKGWRIFQEARKAAGAAGREVRDYSFDALTRVETPQGAVEIRSRVQFILPAFFRQDVESPSGPMTLIFDGDKAWQVASGGRRDLPQSAAALQRQELERTHILLGAAPEPADIRFRREETVEGRPADVIEIADVAGVPLRLFVDQESKDVVKQMWVGDTPSGGMAQIEEFYYKFVTAGGVRWPSEKRVLRNGAEVQHNVRSGFVVNQGLMRDQLLP